MSELRDELEQLNDQELEYVLARAKTNSDSDAIRKCGFSSSTFYRWPEDKRNLLNELAQRFKREFTYQALMKLQDALVDASDTILEMMRNSSSDRTRLNAAVQVWDRVEGKAVQRTEEESRREVTVRFVSPFRKDEQA